jgi:hypothetical protein
VATHRTARMLIGLVLFLTLPFLAANAWGQPQTQPGTQPQRPMHQRLGGTIASVSGTSFVLTARGGRTVTVQTTPTTRIISRQPAALTDLHAGDTVRVVATGTGNGAYTARAVQDVTGGTSMSPRNGGGLWESGSGTVMIGGTLAGTPTGGTMTVATPVGRSITVTVPTSARISRLTSMPVSSLAPGMRVGVQGTPNADGSVTATAVFVVGRAAK